jgi:membrane peptidoglycan carboxypeptidase
MNNFFSLIKLLNLKVVRFSLAVLASFWLFFAVIFYLGLNAAAEHLSANDPRKLNNRSELIVSYNSLVLHKDEQFSLDEAANYFDELGYNNSNGFSAGSYFVEKKTITFTPRSAAFSPAVLSFDKNRLGKIVSNSLTVDKIELEPLPMRNFINYVNRENVKTELVRRIVLSPDAIPPILADAATSAEDTRFFEHHGIDVFGIGYRLVTLRGGGSSITQQLIKNNVIKGSSEEFWQTYLGFLPETLQRKVMEGPFSLAAEEMMSKSQILAAWLSIVPLGAASGVELHGVISASQEYFGKSLSELNLAESAMLAGMIHKPSFYTRLARKNDYSELIARRNRILDLMRRNQPTRYSVEDIENAKNAPVKFVFASENRRERPADAYSRLFAGYVANHLPENLAELRHNEGDFQIVTTLYYRLQKSATKVVEKALVELTKKVKAECQRQKPANIDCETVKPQIALVAMKAGTGEILAMYGGNSLEFNFATAKRSPASAIKPFYYLLALERGIWNGQPFTPETIINPESESVSFRPINNVGIKSTAAIGLAKSYNFHAVAAAESAGLKNAVEFVARLTNSTPEISGMSALGGSKGSETSLLDMVSAYSIFANQGLWVKATPNSFYIQNDRKFALPNPKPERVASTDSTIKTSQMMKLVLSKDGTAPNFKSLANLPESTEIWAKTGSGMVADVNFYAVTPKLVIGVWVGLPKNEINLDMESGFSGGKIASPIVADFLRQLKKSNPELILTSEDFKK